MKTNSVNNIKIKKNLFEIFRNYFNSLDEFAQSYQFRK